jgi:hypothetical protein
MPTTLQTILTDARAAINAQSDPFWSDPEILRYINRGIADVRRSINQTHQDYHFELDVTVEHQPGVDTLVNVPADCGVIYGLEVVDRAAHPLLYVRKDWQHASFQDARQRSGLDPLTGGIIYYTATGVGAPLAAPTIRVAPPVSAVVTLRLTYQPVPDITLGLSDNVPLPANADEALIQWTVAYMVGRQRPDQQPDATRMGLYNVEVQKIMVAIAPRDESETRTVEPLFEEYWE